MPAVQLARLGIRLLARLRSHSLPRPLSKHVVIALQLMHQVAVGRLDGHAGRIVALHQQLIVMAVGCAKRRSVSLLRWNTFVSISALTHLDTLHLGLQLGQSTTQQLDCWRGHCSERIPTSCRCKSTTSDQRREIRRASKGCTSAEGGSGQRNENEQNRKLVPHDAPNAEEEGDIAASCLASHRSSCFCWGLSHSVAVVAVSNRLHQHAGRWDPMA